MLELKSQIAGIIYSLLKKQEDRIRWLGDEISSLGIKYSGLDDIPLDAILPLTALYANGQLDCNEISKLTEIASSKLIDDYTDLLSEYTLISECSHSGKYQLTDKGISACVEIFKKLIVRKKFELQRELEGLEGIYSKLEAL